MKSDEVQVRMQLETSSAPPRFERPVSNNETSFNERRFNPNTPAPRDFDDEEESNGGRFITRGPAMDLTLWLLIFVVFAVMDLIFLLYNPTIVMALPLIVHGVFLPFLFTIAYKQRRGLLPPRAIFTFIQVIIAYMVVYMAAEIVVALFIGNFIMIGIYVFIGVLMVLVWSRVLQQLKYVFGRQQ
jgi:hypothetical protein